MSQPAESVEGTGEPRLDAILGRAILRAQEAADRTIRDAEERARQIVAEAEAHIAGRGSPSGDGEVRRLITALTEIENRLVERLDANRHRLDGDTTPPPVVVPDDDTRDASPARLDDHRFYAALRRDLSGAPTNGRRLAGPGRVRLDASTRTAVVGAREVSLSKPEAKVLSVLVANAGNVVARHKLEPAAAGVTLDEVVDGLRSKLDEPGYPSWLVSAGRAGYRLRAQPR